MINFGFKHKTGILLPISSLPSNYGIGSFGKNAFKFIDFLDETKQKCWQILPLNPTSYGDSPYQSPSSFAGNQYFIDLELLYEDGLLTKSELDENICKDKKINYNWLFNTRIKVLKKAFNRFIKTDKYHQFIIKHNYWLNDYAKFMVLKENNNYCTWQEFTNLEIDEEMLEFWYFIQYKFDEQWNNILEYAHQKNIIIIGDMPIYVALDSVDVWKDKKVFLLDENNYPNSVAGCPPDDFTPLGQVWGNPLYNWEYLKENNFSWWVKRFKRNLELYDIIRIDHFRGFAGYYSIPYLDDTAINGHWEKAYGIELFKKINDTFPNLKVIAEDLGYITDDVIELLNYTNYPGMKILQFAFYEEDSIMLPRMFNTENIVVYTSTHDSDCTLSWINNLDKETKERFENECLSKTSYTSVYALIYLALSSIANLSIIPIQDYLMFSNEEGRINKPSTSYDNWTFKLDIDNINETLKNKILKITIETNRF